MNMYEWLDSLRGECGKKSFPIVAYPGAEFSAEKSIKKIVSSPSLHAQCVLEAAKHMKAAAACTLMDLSVEAECFGAKVRLSDSEVPAVEGVLISDLENVSGLAVPKADTFRAKATVEAVELIKNELNDRPLFAGAIGPFSLAGRLCDITEIMFYCYDYPDELAVLLDKCTEFIINYINLLKNAGADGALLCEPLAGMLSPQLEREFSAPFVKKIVDAVQENEFIVIYHNCGTGVADMAESLTGNGAAAYHFGNAVPLTEMLKKMPADRAVLGNLDPVGTLFGGTPEEIKNAVNLLCEQCKGYDNFVLSTGCDVPLGTPWANIDALFCRE